MKKIFLFLSIILCSNTFAQKAELLEQVDFETRKYKDSIIQLNKFSNNLEFVIEKFRINKKMDLEIENVYTTAGMLQATYNAYASFDVLLNKYYKELLHKLNPRDKETLKQAQRNWIKFKDSEMKLNNLVSKDEYSGGGTIQQLFVASRNLELVETRLNEIYEYLNSRIMTDSKY